MSNNKMSDKSNKSDEQILNELRNKIYSSVFVPRSMLDSVQTPQWSLKYRNEKFDELVKLLWYRK